MQYQNPIIRGFHPDPSICRVNDDYYIVTSSFEFLPGVPIFHSKDLIHWQKIGHCLERPEQMEFKNSMHNAGIFAPTLRFHAGNFYMTTTNASKAGAFAPGGSGNFIMSAKHPAGPWSNPNWVVQGGIDPSLFWDDDGKVYFTSTVPDLSADGSMLNAICQAEINPDTGELLTESKVISYGCGGRFAEAPHTYKKNGYYYLMLAEGGTEFGHMVTISRSTSIWGPYEPCPHNPILTAAQAYDPSLAGTGHGDLVETQDGDWWMVFLCYRMSENYHHHMGRETALAPVEWINDWPVVNNGRLPQEEMIVDRLPLAELPNNNTIKTNYRTTFQTATLGLEWNFFREHFTGYSLTRKPGNLLLMGNKFTLNEKDTPAFIGRRIENFEFRVETCLDFEPILETDEAGLAIAHNPNGHYEFVITNRNGNRKAIVRKTVFDMVVEHESEELPEGAITLQILGDRYDVLFNLKIGERYYEVAKGMVKLLSSEVVGGCIGTYIGMYASGNGKDLECEALYKWFDYEELPKKPRKAMFFED